MNNFSPKRRMQDGSRKAIIRRVEGAMSKIRRQVRETGKATEKLAARYAELNNNIFENKTDTSQVLAAWAKKGWIS